MDASCIVFFVGTQRKRKMDPDVLIPVSVNVVKGRLKNQIGGTVIQPITVTIRQDKNSLTTVPQWMVAILRRDEDELKRSQQQVVGDYARDLAHIYDEKLEDELRRLQRNTAGIFCRDYRFSLAGAF